MSTTILEEILAHKQDEIIHAKAGQLAERSQSTELPRGFVAALRRRIEARRPAVIAEIKKASPSRGVIRRDFDPAAIARQYEAGGAACLSILTDARYFQGSPQHLQQGRGACSLPVLRKDFIIDPWQIAESKALGADCILLIAAALDASKVTKTPKPSRTSKTPARPSLQELTACAHESGLDVLVEVHDRHELEQALDLPARLAPLIGINNRDLHNFKTRLSVTTELLPQIPDDRLVVTESGIHTPADMRAMLQRGVYGFLIGEALMAAPNPGQRLQELLA